uniref:Uncharacterized protein n=1 Tax=Anopheles minimus TaxID=112268 RepID=A0A182WQ16_9DIPT
MITPNRSAVWQWVVVNLYVSLNHPNIYTRF